MRNLMLMHAAGKVKRFFAVARRPTMGVAILVGLPAACCLLPALLAADKVKSLAGDKEALAPLQAYIGDWKGVGQPRRGSTQGAWTEQAGWAWKFSESRAAIEFQSPHGKYFHKGELRPSAQPGTFELVGTLPDGKTQERFAGSIGSDGKLLLKAAAEVKPGRPSQVSIRQVANGDRMLVLFEQGTPGGSVLSRMAEVGYTRQGSDFGKGASGPECVVTGGYGSIQVQHHGQTYYVCCTGCRDLFNDDPDTVLAEYRARKLAEKEKKK